MNTRIQQQHLEEDGSVIRGNPIKEEIMRQNPPDQTNTCIDGVHLDYKIGFLIPVSLDKLENSTLALMIKDLAEHHERGLTYVFYLGFDQGDKSIHQCDRLLPTEDNQGENCRPQVEIFPIEFGPHIARGHLTVMWNVLFEQAYRDGCDYFYQLGDDIAFWKKPFLGTYIETLKKNWNIGVTGYRTRNGNTKIITQSFVSRKHMDIFGYYFPPEIVNWYCDDWITQVYGKRRRCLFPLEHEISNGSLCRGRGGRYRISRDNSHYVRALKSDHVRLDQYLKIHRPNGVKKG